MATQIAERVLKAMRANTRALKPEVAKVVRAILDIKPLPRPVLLTNKVGLRRELAADFEDDRGSWGKPFNGKTPRYKTRRPQYVGLGRASASYSI